MSIRFFLIFHLHHVPDLLRLTALNKLVKGEQALCMGPPGELRNLRKHECEYLDAKSDDYNTTTILINIPSPRSLVVGSPCLE